MDQNPVPGQPSLAPPDAEVARHYLDTADSVAERRARAGDRRALAWLQIANAVITAAYLVAFATLIRDVGGLASQILLFTFLIWTQLSSGMAQRNGMLWRMTAKRLPLVLGGVVVIGAALVVFGFAVWDPTLPAIVTFIPGVIVLIGLGGYGLVQIIRATGDPAPPRPNRRPLTRGLRRGTILVGVAVGSLVVMGGAPDDVLASIIILLIVLLLLAWILAAHSEMGLPTIGAAWRWPHVLVFAISSASLLALMLVDSDSGMLVSSIVGVIVIALFVGVSFVPGRDLRD